jgi:hypothetical protein
MKLPNLINQLESILKLGATLKPTPISNIDNTFSQIDINRHDAEVTSVLYK